MCSICQFFVCFLAFNLNGIFSPGESFVSANLGLHSSKPDFTSHLTDEFRAVIGATKFIPPWVKPLTIFTALDETCLVNQTTSSIDVRVTNTKTVASVTGGVLLNDIYEFSHFQLFWQNHLCNVTHNLETRTYFYNVKYKSFENAQNFENGVVALTSPVSTNGDIPNWKFDQFSKILGKKIKEPGDYTKVHSAFTYTWFVNFPYGSIYFTYKKQFVDPNSGKKYTATVIELPFDTRTNFISIRQYSESFGKIVGVSEKSMAEEFTQDDSAIFKERHKGVCVINLPA